jgi:hypothetical protein
MGEGDQNGLGGGGWTGFTWLRRGTGCWQSWMQWRTFGFWCHGVSKMS